MSASLFQVEVTSYNAWACEPAESPASSDVDIIGNSVALRQIVEQVALVAPTDPMVLILGETGANRAAELLGIKPTTLISRIAKMGLKRPHLDL
jgi:transcriptional regulator with GAF, ATPase, and Fis domain